jgi:DNA-binding LacI/PurR family transcriptional regulator
VAITPEAGGFYVGDLFGGADRACRLRNAQLIVVQIAISWEAQVREPAPIEDYLRIAAEHRDGFMALTSVMPADDLRLLAALPGPSVAIGGNPIASGACTVVADNVGGTAAAVEHLIGHGHRRIGFVGAMSQFDVRQRYESYLATLEKAGIKPDSAICYAVVDDLGHGGRQAAESILEAGIPLSAVFVSTDTQCITMMERLRAADVRIPEDVAIVGFDDSELTQTAVPALTSIRQSPGAIGAAAATLVLDALDGIPIPPGQRAIQTQLIQRHSCGCVANHRHLLGGDTDWLASDWREQLARVLARAVAAPVELPDDRFDPALEWPRVGVVVEGLDDAINGRRGLRIAALDEAWFEASSRTRNADTLMRIVELLEFVGLCRQSRGDVAAAELRSGLQDFLAQSRLQILRYAAAMDPTRNPTGAPTIREVARWFLNESPQRRQDLDWLCQIDAIAGCLALWEPRAEGRPRLRIESLYGETGGTQGGVAIEPESFPPREWLDACSIDGGPCAVMVVPIVSPRRQIGVLAAALPANQRYYSGYWNLQYGAALLALQLERRAQAAEG